MTHKKTELRRQPLVASEKEQYSVRLLTTNEVHLFFQCSVKNEKVDFILVFVLFMSRDSIRNGRKARRREHEKSNIPLDLWQNM